MDATRICPLLPHIAVLLACSEVVVNIFPQAVKKTLQFFF